MKKWQMFNAIVLSIIMIVSNTYAQVPDNMNNNPLEISCDLMSRYIWRGTDFGASPSIQPGIAYNFKNFRIGTWGSFTTNLPGVQEVDLFLSYTFKDIISVSITDYYFPDEISGYNYFDYKDSTTRHIFEVAIAFNGTEKVPVSVFVGTNFYGADARRINPDGTTGGLQYSTYAEVTYSFKYIDAFIGFNLMTPDVENGEVGYYGNAFGVVNLGVTAVKQIPITEKFSLPLKVSLVTNPQAEKIYLVAGFCF
jgi:uncharacterized protein Gcw-chp